LFIYDWFSLCNEIFVDAAVDRLNAVVTRDIDLAVSFGHMESINILLGFLENLKLI
jgi:hypothetical protein